MSQPDFFKHLTKDIDKLAEYKQQEKSYNRNFCRFMDYDLAYKPNDTERKKGIYHFETMAQNLHYQPKIIRPTDKSYDGKTPYFLNSLNNRKVNVSGTLYDIKDIPIRQPSSIRQY